MEFFFHGHRFRYSVRGEGTTLLFLHGLGGRSENWLHQQSHFSARYQVVCPDLPGHGRSEGATMPFHLYWETVVALLDHLGIANCIVCGLSSGARVAIDLAAQRSQRVTSLIAINTFLHLTEPDRARRIALYDLLSHADGPRAWATGLLEAMSIAPTSRIGRGFLRSADKLDPLHIQRIFAELLAYDQRPLLAQVHVPALLVRGESDHFVPRYCAEEMLTGLRNARLIVLPEVGHLPYLEAPSRFNALLDEHLALLLYHTRHSRVD
ncbi:alpha/beta fold hydrolase [Cupriavidus sp. 2KB_3]|uniref:alpha/beta fold hydrolase n=1 Tax=Cupriavidus sp. 2KB_3 TaxID=3232980 RepID=UPI003F908FA5